jgi:endonuclease/exonuclease/phosphatase family metal-dependent hydrolase
VSGQPIRVMSFNLRFDGAGDGANDWLHRRDLLVRTIQRFDPELLGTQEMLGNQPAFLRENLPRCAMLGVGREDGVVRGEINGIFFRRDRFDLIDSGTFWLCETPEKPGIRGWDADCTRLVTFALLRDRPNNGREFFFVNTHWDHIGVRARIESAKLMRQWIADRAGKRPIIISGDFNIDADSEPYRILLGADLRDTYRLANPLRAENEGTYHGFTGIAQPTRIDWIVCTHHFDVQAAAIDRSCDGTRYPSDHFPITAVLAWKTE